MLSERELTEAQRKIDAAPRTERTAGVAVTSAVPESEAEQLVEKIEALEYPVEALPTVIREAVEEARRFVQAPMPLVATSALAAASLAAQSLVDIQRADRLSGPVGLYLLILAESGERKSTADRLFMEPIREWQEKQSKVAEAALREHAGRIEAWEAKQAGLKERIRSAAKSGDSCEANEDALKELEIERPRAPRIPRVLRGDDTPEKLAWDLANEYPAAGVISAEAGIIFGANAMGAESIMRNLAQLNLLWDGDELRVGRKTSDSFTVRGARVTVALQVQEPVLRAFSGRSAGLARGSGFLARFLIARPHSTQGERFFVDPPAGWPALSAFHARVKALLEMECRIGENGLEPTMLTMTPEAQRAWVAFHDQVEFELRDGGELRDVRDTASKAADNAARLAAIFQVVEHGVGAVGLDAFLSASRIVAWHLNEARRFFGELALPPAMLDAVRLDAWVIDHCYREGKTEINKRWLQQHGPVRHGDRLTAALQILTRARRLTEKTQDKQKLIAVHPWLLRGQT